MILVTGGTGLVGSHLLYRLVNNGESVRAIYRRAHKLENVKHVFSYYSDNAETLYQKIEWIETDINNIPKLEEAFNNITHVYHCAAFVSFEPDKYRVLRKINIEGTANIVNLSLNYGIKKLCYVSSIAAIGHYEDSSKLITESTAWNPDDDNSVYAITKYGAELEVWRGTQEGLNAVIVNPGIILGPGYWHSGSSGSLFRQIHKGQNYFTSGASGYIDVSDVVTIMCELMNRSIKNESYILVAENMTIKDFMTKTANALSIQPPSKSIRPWMLKIIWRLDWLNFKIFGKRRRLSKQMAKSLTNVTKYDNAKIKRTLNYNFKPINASIEEICQRYLNDIKHN